MKRNFYLQHSLMAMFDPRMQNLVNQEGLKGLGAYWIIIEKLSVLPEPRAQLEYLRPFCDNKKVPLLFLKKVIEEYDLFDLEADGFFIVKELNPVRKRDGNSPKKGAKKLVFDAKLDENQQNLPQNKEEIQPDENDNSLKTNDLVNNEVTTIKENIKDIITAATTEEKEETAAADILQVGVPAAGGRPPSTPRSPLVACDDFGHPERPLRPFRRWQEMVDELAHNSSWLDLACMKSGYGMLLKQHIKKAVEIFKQHIEIYGKGDDLLKMSDVYGYFINFVRAGSRTSQELRSALLTIDAKEQSAGSAAGNPHRYEQLIGGKRFYLGCPIPDDAPPRPDARAVWNEEFSTWMFDKKTKKKLG